MRWWLTLPIRWRTVIRERGWSGFFKYLITPPRKLVPTKSGWIFFGFMIVIALFGYTTNNNLLFLLFSGLLAIMVLSGVMSEGSLGRVQVVRRFPSELFARSPFFVEYFFENRNRLLGAYAFRVRDAKLFSEAQPPYVVHLPPKKETKVRARATLPKRGIVHLDQFALTTQYPFLLFTKIRDVSLRDEVLVLPALRPVNLSLDRLFAKGEGSGRTKSGDGDIFSYVREYQEGEPLRRVDWKKSARSEEMFTKEFDRQETRKVAVVFNPGKAEDFEAGLEMAASLVVWLYKQRVPFTLAAGKHVEAGYDATHRRMHGSLKRLALYDRPVVPPIPGGANRILEVDANGRYRIR